MSKVSLDIASSELPRVSAAVGPDVIAQALNDYGALVVEDVLDPEALAAIDAAMTPWFDAAFHGAGPFFGRQTRRFGGLLAKAPITAELAQHPLILPVMEQVLPSCDAIELNLTQAIGIEPGEGAQFLHRDDELWPLPDRSMELMANAMWCLDDFTVENGATRAIVGSHRWRRDREPRPGEAASAVARKGSVILWLGSTLHAGGANSSNAIRRGLVMSYKLAWLTGGERLLLSTPPEAARKLPERVQRLIGYQIHRPNLGWVEGQDPIRWLQGETGTLAPVEDNLADMHVELLAAVEQNRDAFAGYLT